MSFCYIRHRCFQFGIQFYDFVLRSDRRIDKSSRPPLLVRVLHQHAVVEAVRERRLDAPLLVQRVAAALDDQQPQGGGGGAWRPLRLVLASLPRLPQQAVGPLWGSARNRVFVQVGAARRKTDRRSCHNY